MTVTGSISDEVAGPPREKQVRDYPARLIEEEAASGEHARGQVRGEKGRGRQETTGRRKSVQETARGWTRQEPGSGY